MTRANGNGFWALAHDLHSDILRADVTGEELRVWLALGGLTQGYGKDRDTIGAGQIADFCGVSRRNVHRAFAVLESKGLVGRRRVSARVTERWILAPGSIKGSVKDSGAGDTRGSVKHSGSLDTLQDTKNKDTKTPAQGRAGRKASGASTTARERKPSFNAWGAWVDACRTAGHEDPLRIGPDLGAGRSLGKLVASGEIRADDLRACMALYLADGEAYLAKQGHPLRLLAGRLNAYLKTIRESEPPPLTGKAYEDLMRIEEELAAKGQA